MHTVLVKALHHLLKNSTTVNHPWISLYFLWFFNTLFYFFIAYLELIGSCFLLLFSLFVSLAYGTIFYTLQEQKINEKINLTRLFKINRNFVFPSKSNGSDINITSLSAKNSSNLTFFSKLLLSLDYKLAI